MMWGSPDEQDPYWYEERCERCGAKMAWIHSSPHCLKCKYKQGCCEGEE